MRKVNLNAGQQKQQHPECCSPPEELDQKDRLRLSMGESMQNRLMIELKRIASPGVGPVDVPTFRANVEEVPKCNIRAAALRRWGNQLYANKQFSAATLKYNESICAATGDSEDLSMGYANRSAVCVKRLLNVAALANIALAKRHNYPERLLSKLLDREDKCRSALETGKPSPWEGCRSLSFNLETNPKIPFLADGIRAQWHPTLGRIMVAEKDFKVGDLILHEKPLCVALGRDSIYVRCNNCYSLTLCMIPCPDCAAAMYCNEKCLRNGQKLHRFECGITSELSMLVNWMGPRMFFHGLSLFDDDVEKMMAFCASAKATKTSYCDLDYSNYDGLEEFRAFLTAQSQWPHNKSAKDPSILDFLQHGAAIFFTMYMEVPLVRSLIAGKVREDFMLQCFLDFQLIKNGPLPMSKPLRRLFPIASAFGYSCHPKTHVLNAGNTLKLVVTRPINRGEEIHISYESLYEMEPTEENWKSQLVKANMKCHGDCCDERKQRQWEVKVGQPSSIDPAHWQTLIKVLSSSEFSVADRLNEVQQFIQRFDSHYPQKEFARHVKMYKKLLTEYVTELETDNVPELCDA